jgi:hypothetical protein
MRCLLIRNKEHGLAYISIRRGNAPSKRGGIYGPKRVDKNNCHNRGSDHRGCDWLSCRTLYSGICVGSSSSNLYCGSVGFGLAEFDEIGNCCSSFVVFSLTSIVMLGGLLLWHSLALATLAGVGVMTGLLIVLSAVVCSYKDASAVQ